MGKHSQIVILRVACGRPDLVPIYSLIEGLRVVQGLRVVPVFLCRYSMEN